MVQGRGIRQLEIAVGARLPQWVEDIGLAVDEWLGVPSICDWFRRNVVAHGESEAKRTKENPPQGMECKGVGSRILPARTLHGAERYWYLAAIREAVCTDADPMKWWGDGAIPPAAVGFVALVRRLRDPTIALTELSEGSELAPKHRKRLVAALETVADELKLQRPQVSPDDSAPHAPSVRPSNGEQGGAGAGDAVADPIGKENGMTQIFNGPVHVGVNYAPFSAIATGAGSSAKTHTSTRESDKPKLMSRLWGWAVKKIPFIGRLAGWIKAD